MTTYLPRTAWTSAPAAGSPMPPRPLGIAVHWPGTTAPIGSRTVANMAARLEGYRRFHVNGRGWADIAYQVGIDQDGRVWDLRGIDRESAANGDQSVNLTYLACLFLLGPGETPGPALLQAFADWRQDRALTKYPTATRVVGHQDIRPHGGTDCPGPATEALIKAGRLNAAPAPQEEDMTPEQADQLHAVYQAVFYGSHTDKRDYPGLLDILVESQRRTTASLAEAAGLRATLAAMSSSGDLTPEQITAAAQAGADAALAKLGEKLGGA